MAGKFIIDDDPAMTDEEFHDRVVHPVLQQVSMAMKSRGLAFMACCEWAKGTGFSSNLLNSPTMPRDMGILMVLASIMLLKDLLATGPDAEADRLEGGLTCGVEALFVGVLIAGAVPLFLLVRGYQYKKRMQDEGY